MSDQLPLIPLLKETRANVATLSQRGRYRLITEGTKKPTNECSACSARIFLAPSHGGLDVAKKKKKERKKNRQCRPSEMTRGSTFLNKEKYRGGTRNTHGDQKLIRKCFLLLA